MPIPLLEIQNLSRNFGITRALAGVDFTLAAGEIHAVLGENGAGKSTLMHLLYGLLRPDSGRIFLEGKPYSPRSPAEARRAGLGMIHQHFMLVPNFTVQENFMLGHTRYGYSKTGRQSLQEDLEELRVRTGLHLDVSRRVADLSVGEQQRVEILKILLRRCRLLILDEPTAVLTPAEVDDLFALIKLLRQEGYGIIFISHKLEEVKALSDRITVLRAGKVSGEFVTAATSVAELAATITPEEVTPPQARAAPSAQIMLKAEALQARGNTAASSLRNLSFEIHAGEILGVAGVDGNGQSELAEVVTGLRSLQKGRLWLQDWEMRYAPIGRRLERGLGHIPSDRKNMGLFPELSIFQNIAVVAHRETRFQTKGWLHLARLRAWSQDVINRFGIRPSIMHVPAATLSGGNQQKLIVARELMREPKLLVAVNPTRGVDVTTTNMIHQMLMREKMRGAAVLLISTEINEIFALADRLVVMFQGRFAGPFPTTISREHLSALMLGADFQENS